MTDASTALVSVVIPTYYRNERLREAIESVQAQQYEPIEIVVVDGSGEAHAQRVTGEYDDVEYVPQEQDEGAHAARSLGAERASGDYVNFLDDDDRMREDKIEKQVAHLRANPDVGVVYCGIQWPGGHVVLPDPDVRGDVLDYALMFKMTPGSTSTLLIDADILDEILPLQNRHGADDMGMKIELARRTKFDFIEEPLLYKGGSEESLGSSRENLEGRWTLIDRYDDLYQQHPPRVKQTAVAYTYLFEANLILERRLWSPRAIGCAARACYYHPEVSVPFTGFLLASLLGRPGRNLGQIVYERVILDDSHRGKIA